jgi:hypothetical protein
MSQPLTIPEDEVQRCLNLARAVRLRRDLEYMLGRLLEIESPGADLLLRIMNGGLTALLLHEPGTLQPKARR